MSSSKLLSQYKAFAGKFLPEKKNNKTTNLLKQVLEAKVSDFRKARQQFRILCLVVESSKAIITLKH